MIFVLWSVIISCDLCYLLHLLSRIPKLLPLLLRHKCIELMSIFFEVFNDGSFASTCIPLLPDSHLDPESFYTVEVNRIIRFGCYCIWVST